MRELISALHERTALDIELTNSLRVPRCERLRKALLVCSDLFENADSRHLYNMNRYTHPHLIRPEGEEKSEGPPAVHRSNRRQCTDVPELETLTSPVDPLAFSWPIPPPPATSTPLQRSKHDRNVRLARAHNSLRRSLQGGSHVLSVEVGLEHEKQRAFGSVRWLGRFSSVELWDSLAYFAYLMCHANGPDVFIHSVRGSLPSNFEMVARWCQQFVLGSRHPSLRSSLRALVLSHRTHLPCLPLTGPVSEHGGISGEVMLTQLAPTARSLCLPSYIYWSRVSRSHDRKPLRCENDRR
jgi:hypothetical protein